MNDPGTPRTGTEPATDTGEGAEAYLVRPAHALDLDRGLLDVLGQLSPVDDRDDTPFYVLWRPEKQVLVAERDGRVVGTVSVVVETKLTRGTSRVAHVEDVVVDESARGSGLGRLLIDRAMELARAKGCYKAVLSCREEFVSFYESNGFRRHEVTMRRDL